MIKIIWTLIGLNTLGLLFFIGAYFVLNHGKNVSYEEKGWTIILSIVGLIVILLAAIPLRYSQSTATMILSGFFALLPLAIFAGVFINKKMEGLKREKTFAETFYHDKTQRGIAAAIENSDTTLLKELIKGQDINKRGPKLWEDEDGLTYLQFAVKVRSNPLSFPFNEEASIAIIKILLANGADPTPALSAGVKYLPAEGVLLLLHAGADPNVRGFINPAPLIFELIGQDKKQNDMAILLLQNGANVNALKEKNYTPLMYAAYRAGTSAYFLDAWRLVHYLLVEAHADYKYTAPNGLSFAGIIENIQQEAKEKSIIMPPDFNAVVAWLKQKNISKQELQN
ncbi:MAG: hypothetical protein ABIP30_03590 [Ferruginibacter sp.]